MKEFTRLFIAIGIGFVFQVRAISTIDTQFQYTTNGGGIFITKWIGSAGAADVPETINGRAVTGIDSRAFVGFQALTNISIPQGVTNMYGNPFEGCLNLRTITIDPRNRAFTSVDGAWYTKGAATLLRVPEGVTDPFSLPSTVTNIGTGAFSFCINLTNLDLPSTVKTVEDLAFYGCTSLLTIGVDRANAAFSSIDGVLFNKAVTTLVQFPGGKGESYSIPGTVRIIAPATFQGATSLAALTIPGSVATIPSATFRKCISLASISVDSSNLFFTSIDGALLNKTGNTLLIVPQAKTGAYTIPEGVTNIAVGAFNECSSLQSVMIPTTLRTLSDSSGFSACDSLTSLLVSDSNPQFTSLNGVLFSKDQTTLVRFPTGRGGDYTVPSGTRLIGNSAFVGCTQLAHLVFPDSITRLGLSPFSVCPNLIGLYFQGNAPAISFTGLGAVYSYVFYRPESSGWGPVFGGQPTKLWIQPPAADFSNVSIQPNGFGFTVTSISNLLVVVEASPSLTEPRWSPVATNGVVPGGNFKFKDSHWGESLTRFYRLRWRDTQAPGVLK